jgi:hypothetical protein
MVIVSGNFVNQLIRIPVGAESLFAHSPFPDDRARLLGYISAESAYRQSMAHQSVLLTSGQ